MKSLRILIADDHSVIREGLRLILETQADLKVIGVVDSGEQICQVADNLHTDVVLMDVMMPGIGGLEATRRLKKRHPKVQVLALSAYADTSYVQQLIAAGASGYILKRTSSSELVEAIRMVAKGGSYLDSMVANKMHSAHSAPVPDQLLLSDRETTVLKLSARGLTNREIGQALGVGVKSVETYKMRLCKKLGLNSRADMVRYAVLQGWLNEEHSVENNPAEVRPLSSTCGKTLTEAK